MENDRKFQYPDYFPITGCVNSTPKDVEEKSKSGADKPKILGSKLAQITATSVSIPFMLPQETPLLEKSSSIEISIDKHNFEYSSNLNSKISGPLRESELLNANHKALKNSNQETEFEAIQKDTFLCSQEKRLPLSKMSGENSGFQQERVTNGINN